MNTTIRAPSRNSSTSSSSSTLSTVKSQDGTPKKAKVTAVAQMDLSSVSLTSNTLPPRTSILNNSVYQPPSSSQRSQQKHQAPPTSTIKIRSSGSVPTTNTIKSTPRGEKTHVVRISNGAAGGVSGSGGGHAPVRRVAPGNGTIRSNSTIKVRSEGSVTSSDDGTVSEDSVEDHIQLFSGAGGFHVNNLSFGPTSSPLSRAGSVAGSMTSNGPRIASGASSMGRNRNGTPISISAPITTTTTKPVRIAAGASFRIDTPESSNVTGGNGSAASSSGLLSTSHSSSTSSSSLSWVSSTQKHNGSAADHPSSPTASTSSTSFQQPPLANNSATAAAVAAKQAEESRRSEDAARTRRKIADLEISNTSLLQLNRNLENTSKMRAAEIQELKARLQS